MATIPIFAPTADYQVGGLQGFNAPVAEPPKDATGAQIAQRGDALGKIGTTAIVSLSRWAVEVQRTQDVADEAETARADAQFAQVVVKDMYGEGGYMNLTGLNATVDRWGQVSGSMHEKQEKIREGLSTEGSRKLFDRHQAGKWPALDAEGLRHAGTQSRAAHLSEALFRSEQEANLALQDVVHWNTPGSIFEAQLLTSLGGLQQALAADGVPQAEIAAKMMKMKTAITSAAVNKLLASGTAEGATQAELYYQAHKEGIDQTVAGGLEKLVHDTVKIAEADQAGYDAFKETQSWASSPAREWNVGPTHLGPTLKDQIDHLDDRLAKKEITIGVHDAAVRRVKDAAAAADAAVAKFEHDSLRTAQTWVDVNPGKPLSSMPPLMRANIAGFENHIEAYIEGKHLRESDLKTVYGLNHLFRTNPVVFRNAPLLQVSHLLTRADLNHFMAMQIDADKVDPESLADKKEAKVVKEFRAVYKSTMEWMDDTLKQLGVDPNAKPGTPEAKTLMMFTNTLGDVLYGMAQAGKPLPKDRNGQMKLAMGLLHESAGGRVSFFAGRQSIYQAHSEAPTTADKIPVEYLPEVEAAAIRKHPNYRLASTEDRAAYALEAYNTLILTPFAPPPRAVSPQQREMPLDQTNMRQER